MISGKTSGITSFKINQVNAADFGRKAVAVFSTRRQAGFSLMEMAIVVAIVMIVLGISLLGITTILPGLRASQAMHQVMSAMREARMLAMSNNLGVRVQFMSNNRIEKRIQVEGCTNLANASCWEDITDRRYNPVTMLGNGNEFWRNNTIAAMPDDFTGGLVINQTNTSGTGGATTTILMFTEDGFLTRVTDPENPISATIFIGLRNNTNNNLLRAVTILGTTGRIRAWRWLDNAWQVTR